MISEIIHAIKRISIINTDTGIEIYQKNYEPSFFLEHDNQLISGFISALIQFSQEIVRQEIEEVVFANSQLYLKRFSIVIVVIMTPLGVRRDDISPIIEYLGETIESNFKEKDLDFITPEISKSIEELIDKCLETGIPIPEAPPSLITKKPPKIVVAGLRKAGKTTAIRSFFDSWNKEQLKSIRPTVDYNIFNSFLDVLKTQITIFDLGGQTQYIEKHLIDQSKWKGATAIIFMVDMQEPEIFDDSFNYLMNIIKLLKEQGETPFIGLLAHKYDPEKIGELQPNLLKMLKAFRGLFEWPRYSVFLTSIYDESLYLAFMRIIARIVPRDLFQNILSSAIFFETQNHIWKTISEKVSPADDSLTFWSKITQLSIPYGENLANKIFSEWLSTGSSSDIIKTLPDLIEVNIKDIAGGMRIDIDIPREGNSLLIVAVIEGLLKGLGNVFGFSRVMKLEVKQNSGLISTSWGLYEF
ncbi:MAG: ADP-ribosylation factor-like protein [Candidatus Hodarchaeales archaeon]